MIVAGFGFRKSATLDSFADAYKKAGKIAEIFTTLTEKSTAPVFLTFAYSSGCDVHKIDLSTAQQQNTLTRSPVSQSTKFVGSVCEATALAAAGSGAILLVNRVISSDGCVTCAIAKGTTP